MGRMVIRAASELERFAIVGLGPRFLAEADLPLPFDAAHVSLTVADYIAAPDKLALVAVGPRGVSGALLASCSVSPLAPVRLAQELAWWVDPQARGRAAFRMLDAYEQWAREQGCALIGMAGRGDARLSRLYRARGFASTNEDHFLKVLN